MSASHSLVVCWAAVLCLVCCCSSAAHGFTYTLYNDSACTQPIPGASYSDPTLLYNSMSYTCLTNVTSYPGWPSVASSAAYIASPITQRGTPNVSFGFHLYGNPNCTNLLQAPWLGAWNSNQNTGVPQGSCTQLLTTGNGAGGPGPFTSAWGTVSVGAPPFPNSYSGPASQISWMMLLALLSALGLVGLSQ